MFIRSCSAETKIIHLTKKVVITPQGTHGVIMVMDITKAWTMDYIRKEAEKVPAHIPILLLANFTDQGHHRQVPFSYPKDYFDSILL